MDWFLDGKSVLGVDGISVSQFGRKSSILNIESIRAEHSGKYTCRATNSAGSAYYTARLAVNGDLKEHCTFNCFYFILF